MEKKEIIVLGGSAGSVKTLLGILPLVKTKICLPIIIVLHRRPSYENVLETVLQHNSEIEVIEIEDKMEILPNRIYLAPPNYHLLIEADKTFTLDDSEKINYSRPNIDVCMQSVVEVFGNKTIGILLTGGNGDGAIGMKKINDAGGYTIIQDPKTCSYPEMPEIAEKLSKPCLKLSPEKIADFVMSLKN